ncbi:MAG: hypothetical protein SFX73_21990 [Kofleriaceae bacterium]|nr:hypothetical protein [Kofleriaceae bacterium]
MTAVVSGAAGAPTSAPFGPWGPPTPPTGLPIRDIGQSSGGPPLPPDEPGEMMGRSPDWPELGREARQLTRLVAAATGQRVRCSWARRRWSTPEADRASAPDAEGVHPPTSGEEWRETMACGDPLCVGCALHRAAADRDRIAGALGALVGMGVPVARIFVNLAGEVTDAVWAHASGLAGVSEAPPTPDEPWARGRAMGAPVARAGLSAVHRLGDRLRALVWPGARGAAITIVRPAITLSGERRLALDVLVPLVSIDYACARGRVSISGAPTAIEAPDEAAVGAAIATAVARVLPRSRATSWHLDVTADATDLREHVAAVVLPSIADVGLYLRDGRPIDGDTVRALIAVDTITAHDRTRERAHHVRSWGWLSSAIVAHARRALGLVEVDAVRAVEAARAASVVHTSEAARLAEAVEELARPLTPADEHTACRAAEEAARAEYETARAVALMTEAPADEQRVRAAGNEVTHAALATIGACERAGLPRRLDRELRPTGWYAMPRNAAYDRRRRGYIVRHIGTGERRVMTADAFARPGAPALANGDALAPEERGWTALPSWWLDSSGQPIGDVRPTITPHASWTAVLAERDRLHAEDRAALDEVHAANVTGLLALGFPTARGAN